MKLGSIVFSALLLFAATGSFANETVEAPNLRSLSDKAVEARDLQTLAQTWNIDPLALSFDASTGEVTISATHGPGDGSTEPVMHFYSSVAATAAGNPSDACYSSSGSSAFLTIDSEGDTDIGTVVDGFEVTAVNNDLPLPSSASSVTFKIDPSVSNTDAYAAPAAGATSATVYFCVRFSLALPGQTISFRELAGSIQVNIGSTFELTSADGIELGSLEIAEDNDEEIEVFPVYAEICEDTVQAGSPVLVQGTPISLCVCTDNAGEVEVTGFNDLTYESGSSLTIIYQGGVLAEGADLFTENLGCQSYSPTKQCCRTDTLLFASFFEGTGGRRQLQATTLTASGSASVAFAGGVPATTDPWDGTWCYGSPGTISGSSCELSMQRTGNTLFVEWKPEGTWQTATAIVDSPEAGLVSITFDNENTDVGSIEEVLGTNGNLPCIRWGTNNGWCKADVQPERRRLAASVSDPVSRKLNEEEKTFQKEFVVISGAGSAVKCTLAMIGAALSAFFLL